MIKKMHINLETKNDNKSVAQFIYTLSHICLKIMIHLDDIENKIKSIKNQEMQNQEGEAEEELDQVLGGAEAEL